METTNLLRKNKRLLAIMLAVAILLMVPLLTGAPWTHSDYIIAAILLGGTGLLYDLAARKAGTTAYKAAAALALVTSLLLLWINLAVGLIGNENNPANLMYFGVIAIELTAAGIARFRPTGMARALYITAAAQFLVPIIALLIRQPEITPGVVTILALNTTFVLLFAGAALLFRHAATRE